MKNIWRKDWAVTELEHIASAVCGCTYHTSEYPDESLNEVFIVEKFSDICLVLSEPKFMRITEREVVKYRLKKGDIIFSHRNSIGQVGKCFLYDLNDKVIHTDRFFRIRANEDYDSQFLQFVLNRSRDAGIFGQMSRQNGRTHHISLSQLRNLCVPSISLSEQKRLMEDLLTFSGDSFIYYV